MRKLFLIPILLLLALPLRAGNIPTNFYVDTAGSDSNTGLATDNAAATVAWVNAFSRTNLLINSEQITVANGWAERAGATTRTVNNSVAPDGTTTATRISFDNVAYPGISQDTTAAAPGNTYTLSGYIRGDVNRTELIEFGGTGTVSSPAAVQITVTTEWTRFTATGTYGAGDGYAKPFVSITQTTDAIGWNDIWGLQLEAGAAATPYIPTVASPVTASFQPSDNVLFKRGQSWAETLTVPSSGTSGAHITYGAYGTGVYPKITGGLDENGKTYVDYGAEAFTFTDITGAPFGTVYTSNAAMYEGIDNQVAVSVSGTGCTYSKNGGAYTATADNVIVNDNVTVRLTSSAAASTATSCVLTIGPNSDTYTVTTRYGIPGRFPEWPMMPSFPSVR